ncbi:tRNA (5-methylaminomethyl-2-thiouridine)(34)-methyltransferase MnmD [Adhaeribacter radiodurans]|uniref:tRNA (5-methylaminomethyl-2-thiouridine)(34)-methyltransferase MnmD n=1 Tax=Adhaeribacter radiodurans TaxID=2745197 RepID=A0A7L7LCW5_9BACT|nr:tRNA (5-methylaminomethyl-2-thiouridine)(34)-methyltransferase MnmD [Adhaeribacter radiodurans]QMU30680.1 tRNA (5-methylaminomethyl-2-thiouridine)(34)-methyltransferase MnmD [Adhaeribacter radiodurans]
MKTEIRPTKDGSVTLYVPELDEHYHSINGALQESMHVFIRAGLEYVWHNQLEATVLEIGFGTGLNALLTLEQTLLNAQKVFYHTLEKYPLLPTLIDQMHFEQFIFNKQLLHFLPTLHTTPWNEPVTITPAFTLLKSETDLRTYLLPPDYYSVIYFDAFAPEKQPELWTDAIFEKLYTALQPNGCLVSYCAKGSFKRSLKAAGFIIEALPGPAGKREMTRAFK